MVIKRPDINVPDIMTTGYPENLFALDFLSVPQGNTKIYI